MKALELKVPPLLLIFLIALLMYGCAVLFPSVRFGWVPVWIRIILLALGILLPLLGWIEFRKANTTVDPRIPDKSSTLVTSGIYRWTRNPMYLGFLVILFAWGLSLHNMAALLGLPLYMFYMNLFQIKPEERQLENHFGDTYREYKKRVGRWW